MEGGLKPTGAMDRTGAGAVCADPFELLRSAFLLLRVVDELAEQARDVGRVTQIRPGQIRFGVRYEANPEAPQLVTWAAIGPTVPRVRPYPKTSRSG